MCSKVCEYKAQHIKLLQEESLFYLSYNSVFRVKITWKGKYRNTDNTIGKERRDLLMKSRHKHTEA